MKHLSLRTLQKTIASFLTLFFITYGLVLTPNTTNAATTLIAANVELSSRVAGETVTATVTFTTTTYVPQDGVIRVTFPGTFSLISTPVAKCSSMDGSFAVISGRSLVIEIERQHDGTIQNAGSETCTVSGIINRNTEGLTGTYRVETLDGLGSVLESDLAIAEDTIVPAKLTGTNVQPATTYTATPTTVIAVFTLPTELDGTEKIKITFPTGYNVVGATGATCTGMGATPLTTTVLGQTVIIARTGALALPSGGTYTCSIGGIETPSASGMTGVYTIIATDIFDRVSALDTAIPGDILTTSATRSIPILRR